MASGVLIILVMVFCAAKMRKPIAMGWINLANWSAFGLFSCKKWMRIAARIIAIVAGSIQTKSVK